MTRKNLLIMTKEIITQERDFAHFWAKQNDAPSMPEWLENAPISDELPHFVDGFGDDSAYLDIGQYDHLPPFDHSPQTQSVTDQRNGFDKTQGPKKEKQAGKTVTYEYQDFVGHEVVDHLLAQGDSFIMKADTGHGKTTAIEASKQCAILAMPMQAQVMQRQAKGASFAVYEGVSTKDVPLDWRNIATTYNSLPRVMAACFPDLLAIDEIHHFLTDSYRQSAIRDAYRAIRAFDGPKILMSATPLANILTSTIFPDFQTAICKDVGTKRVTRQIPIVALDGGVVDHALSIARSGIVNGVTFPANGVIICHVNDKTAIEAAINHINNTIGNVGTAYGFTADTKEESHHEMMINDGALPADCRFLFTTSLINDAFSFGPRANVVLVSRQSSLLPHEVVQLCARWRNGLDMALPMALFIFKREPDKKPMDLSHNGPIFAQAVKDEYKRLFEIAQTDLKRATMQREMTNGWLDDCTSKADLERVNRQIEKINATFTDLIFRKDEIEIDHIAILQKATEANRHMGTGQLIREIEEYGGFYFVARDASANDEEERVREAKILLKQEEKATKSEQFANVLEVARTQGIDLIKRLLDGLKEYPDSLPDGTIEGCRAVASLWRLIEKRDGNFDRLLDTMAERKITSKNKADKLAKRVRMSLVMASGEQLGQLASVDHASAKALQALGQLLPSGARLTDEKIKEVSQAMGKIEGSRMIGRWDNKAKTVKSIKALFECKRTKGEKKKDGKRSDIWRVDGLFDLSSVRKEAVSETAKTEKVRQQQGSMF